ncbi:tetratricopeptide repeat protein [Thermospira aquatica]|uniref:Tetratricopeptide repeat protein n=1 Tax=Thermospira aquatica TaxID=2828656 RepID=A0AAX3BFU3_9SPIR|nr:hypothetical protein [Thermospira aquatica]URA11272.1 hypothetical protein KDW03_05610 [Thermospira aquatica]
MKKELLGLFLWLAWGGAAFCQEHDEIYRLVEKGMVLDGFQRILHNDVRYTNFSLMIRAANLLLQWGISSNGEEFLLSNSDGEKRSYYFPVEAVLLPFTNQYAKDGTLWETLCRYYARGFDEGWFFTEEKARRFLQLMDTYQKTVKTPLPSLLASQVRALKILQNTNEAWSLATNLVARYPKDPDVVFIYAEMLYFRQNGGEALQTLQQFYPQLVSLRDRVRFGLLSAQLYLENQKPQEALFLAERLLAYYTNETVFFLILEASYQLKQWRRFTDRGLLLLGFNPESTENLVRISRFFILARQREWAEVFFEKALDNYGVSPLRRGLLYFYLGEVYRNLQLRDNAIGAYEQARAEFLLVEPVPSENLAMIDMMIYRTKNP